jgi:anti-anti-sigma regulatory factor
VRIVPTGLQFDWHLDIANEIAELTLTGTLDNTAELPLKAELNRIVAAQPQRLLIRMEHLQSVSMQAARALSFVGQGLDLHMDMYVVGANDAVKATLQNAGWWATFINDASQLEST